MSNTFYVVYKEDDLQHHGVKGQKWGVRRYQNANGSYTLAGRIRYGLDEKMGRDQKEASNRYQRWGMSKDKANKLSAEKKEMLKKIAIGTGIAVGSAAVIAAAYYGGSYVRRNILGLTIKAGKTIQTLQADPDRLQNGEDFYAAFKRKDKARYLSRFSKDQWGNNKFNIKADAIQDLKIAPRNTATKVMNDLIKSDPSYASYAKDSSKWLLDTKFHLTRNPKYMPHAMLAKRIMKNPNALQNLNKHDQKLLMEIINLNQVNHDSRAQTLFEALKNKGFQGIIDTNDANRSGFNTDAVILFNSSGLKQQSVEKIKDSVIASAGLKDIATQGMESLIKYSPAIAGIVGIKKMQDEDVNFDLKVKDDINKNKTGDK